MESQTSNEKLQHECDTMVQNYSRKIMAQEETIRSLNQRLEHATSMSNADPDYESMLRRENEGLKSENQLMKDRVAELAT